MAASGPFPSGGAPEVHPWIGRSFARAPAGRIVEVRALRLADLTDVERLNAEVIIAIRRAGPGALVYADHRYASPVPCDIADAWARGMRSVNRSVARSAILLDPANTTFNLQLERIVRCAGNASRRIFSDLRELHAWMEGQKSDPEREAVARFFSGRARELATYASSADDPCTG